MFQSPWNTKTTRTSLTLVSKEVKRGRILRSSCKNTTMTRVCDVICIMHGAMGPKSTGAKFWLSSMMEWTPTKQLSLHMWVTTKTTIGLFQLHVSHINIVIHDHGDGAYAHYAIELWPKVSNFILLSLARCLRILEKPSVCNYKKLFDEPPLNDYFEELL